MCRSICSGSTEQVNIYVKPGDSELYPGAGHRGVLPAADLRVPRHAQHPRSHGVQPGHPRSWSAWIGALGLGFDTNVYSTLYCVKIKMFPRKYIYLYLSNFNKCTVLIILQYLYK